MSAAAPPAGKPVSRLCDRRMEDSPDDSNEAGKWPVSAFQDRSRWRRSRDEELATTVVVPRPGGMRPDRLLWERLMVMADESWVNVCGMGPAGTHTGPHS